MIMTSIENTWEEGLVIVLIAATIMPGVIYTVECALDPPSSSDDNPYYIYAAPIYILAAPIALLSIIWPLGVGIAVAIVIAYLRKSRRIAYALWVIYLVILYILLLYAL